MVKRYDCGYAYKTALKSLLVKFWHSVECGTILENCKIKYHRQNATYDTTYTHLRYTNQNPIFFGSLFHSLVEIRKEHKTDLRNLI